VTSSPAAFSGSRSIDTAATRYINDTGPIMIKALAQTAGALYCRYEPCYASRLEFCVFIISSKERQEG
jgi:hypothetical protein